jgi:AcrR family transcriptional regulator
MTAVRAETSARGRPRDAALDRRIAEAALDVLADSGIAAFTIEAVAHRAGVGKATIYRRYDGRDDVLAAALDQLRDDTPAARSEGSSRERLEAALDFIRSPMTSTRGGRVMAQVISAGAQHPDFLATFYDRVLAPRRQMLLGILRDGVSEGWVDPDADLDSVVTLLVGPMIFLKVWHGTPVASVSTEEILDLALRGVGVSAPASGS